MTARIKLGFVVEADQIGAALRAMGGIALGVPTIMDYYPDAKEFTQQLEVDPDQTPEDGEPFHGDPPEGDPPRDAFIGKVRLTTGKRSPDPDLTVAGNPRKVAAPGRAKIVMDALAVLREVGTKGIVGKAFHAAMIKRGVKLQDSYNALFLVKKRGFVRVAPNNRLYITREGNAFQ